MKLGPLAVRLNEAYRHEDFLINKAQGSKQLQSLSQDYVELL